jgi:hypothetical protein
MVVPARPTAPNLMPRSNGLSDMPGRRTGAMRVTVARSFSVVALSILVMSGPAHAALTQDSFLLRNTGDLIGVCSATQGEPLYTAAVNFCHGFAVGVFRVLNEQGIADPSDRLFCLPDQAPSRNQMIAELVQWAKASPARANDQPADTIAAFLAQRFPCPQGRSAAGTGR